MAFDDPIVYPREPGKSHLHTFFGNTGANAFSTAASIAGMKVWLTNEYEHNGLRASPEVFERLLAMRRDQV